VFYIPIVVKIVKNRHWIAEIAIVLLILGFHYIFSNLHHYSNETIDLNARIYGAMAISTIQIATGIYLTMSCAVLIQRCPTIDRFWIGDRITANFVGNCQTAKIRLPLTISSQVSKHKYN
jgi:hypothetical protein